MRRGVGLCVLGLMCLHGWVLGQEVQTGTLEFCDEPMVEEAVSKALDHFNENVVVGHKMALYQILSAVKSENGSGAVYSVQFSSRKSDCPAGSAKSWSECGYLSDSLAPKEPSPCNATVYMTDTEKHTLQVYCQMDDLVVPVRARCLGCPEEMHMESEDLKVPLSVSIHKFNSISDSTHLFTLNSIGFATRQVVAGFRYKLSFDMRKSTCSKDEHKTISDICVPNAEDVELANCNATVDMAPWRHEAPEVNVECGPGALMMIFTRRRPPGWSPIRSIINFQAEPSTASPPTTISATEESSEEDPSDPSSSPDVTTPTGAPDRVDSPFHCPSKPWKEFSPVQPGTATATTEPEPAPARPSVQGAFSDLDLVG